MAFIFLFYCKFLTSVLLYFSFRAVTFPRGSTGSKNTFPPSHIKARDRLSKPGGRSLGPSPSRFSSSTARRERDFALHPIFALHPLHTYTHRGATQRGEHQLASRTSLRLQKECSQARELGGAVFLRCIPPLPLGTPGSTALRKAAVTGDSSASSAEAHSVLLVSHGNKLAWWFQPASLSGWAPRTRLIRTKGWGSSNTFLSLCCYISGFLCQIPDSSSCSGSFPVQCFWTDSLRCLHDCSDQTTTFSVPHTSEPMESFTSSRVVPN